MGLIDVKSKLTKLVAIFSLIAKKLSELTNNQRLAFGSFVDKTVAPYVKFET